MRLKVRRVSEGPGPGEVVVEIETSAGTTEEVIIHLRSIIEGDTIEVGYPIYRKDDKSLIELPREAMSGLWRLWVPSSSVA